jgi:UDP:flavonoid glycosyltransferase YjiC (YdhE family)
VSRPLRAIVGALGWKGHTFPILALARALRARGHEVVVDTTERWRDEVEELGLRFMPAEDSITFAGLSGGGDCGPTLAEAARSRQGLLREFEPDVVVSDVLTLAPGLAAEVAGVPHATLVPHLYPERRPGSPFFSLGLQPPRTPLSAAVWRALGPFEPRLLPRLDRARRNLNRVRTELGLAPADRLHNAISEQLALVATFPQLEYPRPWPAHVNVTGPMFLEQSDPPSDLPPGDDPIVLVHSSTEQDPELRLIATALEALEDEPVRLVATMSRKGWEWPGKLPANAVITDWVSYPQLMPRTELVVCCGGHGTVARGLAEGIPLLVCPPGADMAENGARVAWAEAGLVLPGRLLTPAPLRWSVRRVLGDPRFASAAEAIAAWARTNDGAAVGAELVERFAR